MMNGVGIYILACVCAYIYAYCIYRCDGARMDICIYMHIHILAV